MYADGVWLAELAALRDPAQVAASVADVLQVRQRGPDSGPAELATAIGTSELLLVLDNCEHLVGSCAEVADGLLRACPQLRILATSREPLGVPGEVTWRVPSLPFPAGPPQVPPGDLARFEAVRLFAERARLARPRFTLTEDNAAAVAEICARLDGIPLAIELAAARARVFSAAQIAAGLQDRFRLLTGGARTAVPRQQTLEASVAWSYDLLAEPERAVLRQLSVFAGGFTLEAAGAVAIGAGQPEAVLPEAVLPEASCRRRPAGGVLPLVSSLADKSLIVAAEDGTGDRFRMLETIRDYAAARLLEAGEAVGAQARHFGFFARAVDRRPGEDEDSYCERLRADYDNIRVALGWASRQDAPELLLGLATRLVVFWSASTHLAEAVQWLRSATERGRDADPGLRARALGALTQIASLALDLPVAFAAGTEGLAVLRQLGDKEGIVMTLTSLGFSAPRASRVSPLPDGGHRAGRGDRRPAGAGVCAGHAGPGRQHLPGRPPGRARGAAPQHRGGPAVRRTARGRHRAGGSRRAERAGRPPARRDPAADRGPAAAAGGGRRLLPVPHPDRAGAEPLADWRLRRRARALSGAGFDLRPARHRPAVLRALRPRLRRLLPRRLARGHPLLPRAARLSSGRDPAWTGCTSATWPGPSSLRASRRRPGAGWTSSSRRPIRPASPSPCPGPSGR